MIIHHKTDYQRIVRDLYKRLVHDVNYNIAMACANTSLARILDDGVRYGELIKENYIFDHSFFVNKNRDIEPLLVQLNVKLKLDNYMDCPECDVTFQYFGATGFSIVVNNLSTKLEPIDRLEPEYDMIKLV